MKTILCAAITLALASGAWAATTINSTNHFGYGPNIGWMDWRGDTNNGAVIGEFVCSGFIYAANVGWINLGGGAPANGIRYQNNSASDFGVNHDGTGNLRGYAWGANIGWLTFTNRDATGASYAGPRVDFFNGRLSGFIWSANCGWISLSNAFAFVRTDTISPGADSDGDGIADAYERTWFTNLTTINGVTDFDGDKFSDVSEYLADTNPMDTNSSLRFISYGVSFASQEVHALTWSSRTTRLYRLEHRVNLNTNVPWQSLGLIIGPEPGATTSAQAGFTPISGQRYWRVSALRPLNP